MKKKGIIIGLIILLSSITAIILVLTLRNTKTRLVLNSYDEIVTIDLGEYKVKDYKKNIISGGNYEISFYVTNKRDFYNEVIIKSDYYKEELDFDLKANGIDQMAYVYGYFIEEYRLFNYFMDEKGYVRISSCSSYFIKDNYYYNFDLPLYFSLSRDRLNVEEKSWIYTTLTEKLTNYDMMITIAKSMNSAHYAIEEDCIYVKGYYFDDKNIEVLSDDYLIKIYEDENGKVKVGNVY